MLNDLVCILNFQLSILFSFLVLSCVFFWCLCQQPQDLFKDIISHCKEYGFIYQSSEIYDGLSAVYDYGPYGSELKKNIREYWWKAMVQMHENIVGIDAAIFMHATF